MQLSGAVARASVMALAAAAATEGWPWEPARVIYYGNRAIDVNTRLATRASFALRNALPTARQSRRRSPLVREVDSSARIQEYPTLARNAMGFVVGGIDVKSEGS